MRHPFFLLVMALILNSCSKNIYKATDNKNIAIDGDASDWDLSDIQRVPDENLLYAVNRDKERLFVLVKSTDPQVSKKIQALGLTIWVDGKGKKKKRQGITYPISIAEDIFIKRIQQRKSGIGNRDFQQRNFLEDEQVLQHINENKNTVELTNFFDDSDEPFKFQLSELRIPIEAARKRAGQGELVIELAIPLNTIKKKKGKISIGLETGKLEFQRPGGSSGNFRPGLVGRRPGFRQRPVASNPQRREQFKELNTPIKHWEKVEID
ncbi:MAG: hypothetical protein AAF363_11510 [Bacteroidota bacterium]